MELASCRWTAPPATAGEQLRQQSAAVRAAWCLPPAALAAARRRQRAPEAAPATAAAAAPGRQRRRRQRRLAAQAGSSNGVPNGTARHSHDEAPNLETLDLHPERSWTKFVAETLLPTKQGKFRLRGYRHTVDGGLTYTEPSVIISGRPEGLEDVPVRVHDACFTSEVLGSLKCDCREQLRLAMDYIRDRPPGMVIYLQQEGRGIGLANKIAAYALQEKGLDTVDANRALGLPDDCREYSAVKDILQELGIKSIRLMTNNPRKIAELAALGIPVSGRIPCQVPAQKYNAGYLGAKHRRMAHILNPALYASTDAEDGEQEPLEGQFCYWDHEGEPSSAGIPLEAPVPLPDGLETASASALSSSDGGSRREPGSSGGGCGSASSVSSAGSMEEAV